MCPPPMWSSAGEVWDGFRGKACAREYPYALVFRGKLEFQAWILEFGGGVGATGCFVAGGVEIRELAVYHTAVPPQDIRGRMGARWEALGKRPALV